MIDIQTGHSCFMCTVTVHQSATATQVTMNRDEMRDRGPELPPIVRRDDTLLWVTPVDSVSKGSWMGINTHGVVACLLNLYMPGDRTRTGNGGRASRGSIVPSILKLGSFDATCNWLTHHFDPSNHPSFSVVITTQGKGRAFSWIPGAASFTQDSIDEPWWMTTSSSWRTAEVLAWRQARFEAWREEGEPWIGWLPRFHLLQPEGREEWAPLMQRETTCTRSITQASMDPSAQKVTLRYWPLNGGEPPDPESPRYTISLPWQTG